MLKELIKKIHIFHSIYIKHKYLIKKDSYSMEGEDLAIKDYTKNIKDGFYVDLGCYHPLHLNNTYLLHKNNWNGINVDISEFSIDLFNFLRPNDININSAISNLDSEITFYYQKKLSQLSTIKKDVSKIRFQGPIKEKQIKSFKLNTILDNSFYKNRRIDFLNIDLEGADLDALKSLNFEIYRPKIICVEIINKNIINSETYKYLSEKKYKMVWSSKTNLSHIFII